MSWSYIIKSIAVGFLLPCVVFSEEISKPSIGAESRIEQFVGFSDPSVGRRLATIIDVSDLISVAYHGSRPTQMAALEALGYLDNPRPALPYLVALVKAKDRSIASLSAHSLYLSFERLYKLGQNNGEGFLLDGQAAQLSLELAKIAYNSQLDTDLRVMAIRSIKWMLQMGIAHQLDIVTLLSHRDPAIRRVVIGLIDVPIKEEYLNQLVSAVKEDIAVDIQGTAAALLCENAVAHGVKEPTPALFELLSASLSNNSMPAEGVVEILACLKNFEVSGRLQLVDIALKHPNSSVAEYWNSISQ